jgi:precorrin-6A/cobalt-precorrin-6A reductase
VLILGGTGEARELAAALDDGGVAVTSSLAGRVDQPRLPRGAVRIGGFGGPDGLTRWLAEHRVAAVVDATHPFSTQMGASAVAACHRAGVGLLRLERPGWQERQGDDWHRVADTGEAAAAIGGRGRRVLLTLGRRQIADFAGVDDAWFLIRSVDPPASPLPARHEVLLDRGPFTLDGELALIDRHRIDVVVTRDSGGDRTSAKLDAARERGLPVIVLSRPPRPDVPAAHTIGDAVRWAERQLASGRDAV